MLCYVKKERENINEGGKVPPLLFIVSLLRTTPPLSEPLLEQVRLRGNDIPQKLLYLLLSRLLNACTTAKQQIVKER